MIAWCGLIFFLSSQSALPLPPMFPHADKLIHAGAYAVMGIFAWRMFQHSSCPAVLHMILSVCVCSLYGISDEWHQSFVPGRDSDVADWLADTIGALLAVSVMQGLSFGYCRSSSGT
ncbi:MAG: hypothetical protein AUJ56_02975 [Zetaproteobacteria bacterium CG1_02_49_23]|nr:MAG: hypothetical protein AUJ56_02975 [Zetaproteobacteria bacterium CG1_02_49_23]